MDSGRGQPRTAGTGRPGTAIAPGPGWTSSASRCPATASPEGPAPPFAHHHVLVADPAATTGTTQSEGRDRPVPGDLIPYVGCQGGVRGLGLRACTGRPLPRQGCCASLRDGLRPPLTREPLPALGQALSGRPWPARWVRAARARSSGLTGCGYPRRIVGGRVASFVDVAFSGVRVTCHAAVCGLLRGLPPLLLVVGC